MSNSLDMISVPDHGGKKKNILLRLSEARILEHEAGRGARMSKQRTANIQELCADAVIAGLIQIEICRAIGASRSRVSRWTVAGIRANQDHSKRRLLRDGRETLTQMMWARIDISNPESCWEWRGGIKPNGYGSLNFRGKAYNAHRLVYEILVSEIPE